MKVGRNDPCPCGSGKKFKKCCINLPNKFDTETHNYSTPKCGLCGKTTHLIKTECCGQWICDDKHREIQFFKKGNCYTNHKNKTLCGYHHANGHSGNWKECYECKGAFRIDTYVYLGTNAYNFEILEDPPEYEFTECVRCGAELIVEEDASYMTRGGYICEKCAHEELKNQLSFDF